MAALKSHAVASAGTYTQQPVDHLSLTYENRLLRRKRLVTAHGTVVLLDLSEVISLNANDALILEDGGLVRIDAAPETLIEVRGAHLHRLAWHIGNRHTPCQIEDDRLLILDDHVLRKMLTHLGAELADVVEPFTPEGGAYGHGRTFGHSHGPADHAHSHDHDHDHGGDHDHEH